MTDKKNILIGVLLFAIIAMSVGYAAFATTLNINGTATISGEWDVEITEISSEKIGNASDNSSPSYNSTTATFDTILTSPNDAMIYTITIENKGSIDATLNDISFSSGQESDSDAIKYSIISQPEKDSILVPGATATVSIRVEYDPTVTITTNNKTKTFTSTIEYVQK